MRDPTAETVIRARHASFAEAMRRGDVLEAARAGARLRLGGAPISARELTAARRARTALGRALVKARWMRPTEELAAHPIPGKPAPTQVMRPLAAKRRLPVRQAAAAALVLVIAFIVLRPGGGFLGGGPGGPAPNPTSVPGATTADHLFGRTVSLVSPVAASATPLPSTTPRPTGTNQTNTPIGGSGTGSPQPGGGGGVLPTPNPSPDLPGLDYGRLTVVVTDSIAHRPISGVCVALGAATCDQSAKTDQNGKATQDIKLPAPRTEWDITIVRAGYAPTTAHATLIQGKEVVVSVVMTPQQ